jgi:hypothetical protein
MAEQKPDARDVTWRRLVPWTEIFNGFKLTLDPNKFFLAAAGILVMAFAWWFLAVVFGAAYKSSPPTWPGSYLKADADTGRAWTNFLTDRDRWNLMHTAAGIGGSDALILPQDLAESPDEYQRIEKATPSQFLDKETHEVRRSELTKQLAEQGIAVGRAAFLGQHLFQYKGGARLATWPWFEYRGPNPYLLVTGAHEKPWETGHFWEWFATEQAPTLLEPLRKLLSPVVYLLDHRADAVMRLYFFLVLLSTLAIWSVFGGAIARITVMYQTRKEQIDAFEAFRFARRRLLAYIGAPLFPLGITLACLIVVTLLGLFYMIPWFGDVVVAGLGWFLFVGLGAGMAVLLIGLVAWPLMPATISTEGRDAWEAFSRAYAYLFSKPWQYIWYGLVAIAYGAVLIFFVNFLGSFAFYMSKWSINQTPGVDYFGRQPNFLFVYAPTTFEYRALLLEGAEVKEGPVVQNGRIDNSAYLRYLESLGFNNKIGAFLVALWLGAILLLIIGFGYAYFWTASTLIYLLLRRQIDTAEVDEVYLDDEDGGYKSPTTTPRTPATTPTTPTTQPQPQMVASPTLKTPATTPTTPTPTPTPPPATTPTPTPTPTVSTPTPTPTPTSTPEPHKDAEPEMEKKPETEKKPDTTT